MRLLKRFLQRLAIFGLGLFSVWFIVFVVFEFADRWLPWFLALAATYGIAAYIVLPRVVRMGLKVLQHKRVPRYTITAPLTFTSVGLLAIIVIIRTFLSFSLETEIEGCWPWQRQLTGRTPRSSESPQER